MFDWSIELVKFVGGLGGLASSIFLVYDRLFRLRPLAFLVSADYRANLRLRNVADETIVIDQVMIKPPVLKLARANDLVTMNAEKAAALYKDAKLPEDVYVIIEALGERTFALDRLPAFESAADGLAITIRCKWRNTRRPFPLNRYVRVRITKKEIVDFREASLAGKI